MTQVCSQCAKANPSDASYCYFDGVRLPGASANGGAVSGDFPSQFVFPTGQVCKNFDQLATACQQNWQTAVDLLKKGFLVNFFGGLGRADLAMAAQEAAQYPDQDRGLDQFLDKLPTEVLARPKLQVEPTEINLGQVPVGKDHSFELHLGNQGMRLLYGSLASDSKWLTIGDAPGQSQKLFQFGSESVIPLHINGQHLRAGTKPLEGQILIESNGGNAMVTVRVEVPITPFKEGVLAGSVTPRQIAEKARAQPAKAAPLFEKGLIAEWFQTNGWIYPVKGPSASGLGGIQQFFEALGLAKAPKVTINVKSISLKGDVGKSAQAAIEVSTPEKKPVYAHATCDQAWVDTSKVKLAGRVATIAVNIPSIPDRPGETLTANLQVSGNGNQRFTVPLSLQISGTRRPAGSTPPPPPTPSTPAASSSATTSPAAVGASAAATSAPAADDGDPFSGMHAGPAKDLLKPAERAAAAAAMAGAAAPPQAATEPAVKPARKSKGPIPAWMHHVAPLAVLGLALLGILVRDMLLPAGSAPIGGEENLSEIDETPRIVVKYDYARKGDSPKLRLQDTMRFGIHDISEGKNDNRFLLYGDRGHTSNMVIKIDDKEYMFGNPAQGKWVSHPKFTDTGSIATFGIGKIIDVTQEIKIIPGQMVEITPNVFKRLMNNCLIKYTVHNKDTKSHKVALRMLLDTYIGSNDGVPFAIPGQKGLVDTSRDFNDPKKIPDFLFALERPDFKLPGTVAQLNLKVGGKIESPERVLLTRWPAADVKSAKERTEKITAWKIPVDNMTKHNVGDSAVVMYWPEKVLEPGGDDRVIGCTYGLGSLNATDTGELALNIGGSFVVDGELSVVALVSNVKKKDEKIKITFDDDSAFGLIEGDVTQDVPVSQKGKGKEDLSATPITWRLQAKKAGVFTIRVELSSGVRQMKRIEIRRNLIF